MINRSKWTLFLVLVSLWNCEAQLEVWPGDVNNNGQVTNLDFLPLGLSYNFFGPARNAVSSDFAAQPAPPWNFNFANGVNFAFADCNGDGFINYIYDAFPIYVHYGATHGTVTPDVFQSGTNGIDPPLFLESNAVPPVVSAGQALSIPIVLGTQALPVEDFYGIAFSIHVEPDVIDVDNIQADFTQLSWANPDQDRIYAQYRASSSRLDIAWVRTDRNNQTGHGPIGTLNFIVIEDVVSLQRPDSYIYLDSVRMIDRFGNETLVSTDTLHFNLQEITASNENLPDAGAVRIQPNPTSGLIFITAEAPIERAEIFALSGKSQARQFPNTAQCQWDITALPTGIYLMEIQTSKGIQRTRLVKTQ